ncbi:hypothetical protein Mapa_011915 [Marchantia paleacea]|nr:hypothetical protein Mapa_011915 [Marchantia paleacea]
MSLSRRRSKLRTETFTHGGSELRAFIVPLALFVRRTSVDSAGSEARWLRVSMSSNLQRKWCTQWWNRDSLTG